MIVAERQDMDEQGARRLPARQPPGANRTTQGISQITGRADDLEHRPRRRRPQRRTRPFSRPAHSQPHPPHARILRQRRLSATRPTTKMRESNFAFPAQNRACVCISSQLYDRRGALCAQNALRVACTEPCPLSTRHELVATPVQLAYPSRLSHFYLSPNTRDHDHGRRSRAARAHPPRLLHMSAIPRKSHDILRLVTTLCPPTETRTYAQPQVFR